MFSISEIKINLLPKEWNIHIDYEGQYYEVAYEQVTIAILAVSFNSYHNQHLFLYPYFKNLNKEVAKKMFHFIHLYFQKPLQIMISSTEKAIIDVIEYAGFKLKRKSYEREFNKLHYIKRIQSDLKLTLVKKSDKIFDQICKMTYKAYQLTHENINPLTSTIGDFKKLLPNNAICHFDSNGLKHCCFIENNEICYFSTNDLKTYDLFAVKVIDKMFDEFNSIVIEIDNVDPPALVFYHFFHDEYSDSFDTFILGNN